MYWYIFTSLSEEFGVSVFGVVQGKYFPVLLTELGWDSSVGIATRYGLDGPGIESRWGARFSVSVQTGSGAHPASYAMGTGSIPGG